MKYDNQVNTLRVNLMSDWVSRPCPDQANTAQAGSPAVHGAPQ